MAAEMLHDDKEMMEARRTFRIGRAVSYQPVQGDPKTISTTVRSVPWRLGGGQIVVAIEGRSGGVSIKHLKLREGK